MRLNEWNKQIQSKTQEQRADPWKSLIDLEPCDMVLGVLFFTLV